MSRKIATISILLLIISIIIGIGIGIGIASAHVGGFAEHNNATVDLAHHSDLSGLAVRGDVHCLLSLEEHVAAQDKVLHNDV